MTERKTREERQRDEFRSALKAAQGPLVEPSEDEKRNGWDAESLTAYLQEQQASASLRIDPSSLMRKGKPVRANNRYSPLRWRG